LTAFDPKAKQAPVRGIVVRPWKIPDTRYVVIAAETGEYATGASMMAAEHAFKQKRGHALGYVATNRG
jgi:hypothetical protein